MRTATQGMLAALAFFAVACGPAPRPKPAARLSSPFPEPAPASRHADDVARFLAGMPGPAGSAFQSLERDEAWQTHRAELDRSWNRYRAEVIDPMTQFQGRELAPVVDPAATVFYPFSGPDSLNVTVFFPRNPVYVMVGLEPPGTLPDVPHTELRHYLSTVRTTVYSGLHRSFFITREMDRQFRGQVSDGLLPAILHLLVRGGHTISGYRYVQIDGDGRVVARERNTPRSRNDGVEIDFRRGNERTQRLFYFSLNLSESRLRQNVPFQRFVAQLGPVATYLKATSYLTHRKEFARIRALVLEKSSLVLQDDCGIPYRFFDVSAWKVQLYGDYTRPYGSFRYLEQKDLRDAYGKGTARPLAFRIGYGFGRIPSNLQLAVKNKIG